MEYIEFEVWDDLPPRNPSSGSIWVNDNEVDRLIQFRKAAYDCSNRKKPFIGAIKLEIEIWTPKPELHTKPGDLDNFIKGVCDSLFYEYSKQKNIEFKLHNAFELSENENIKPQNFQIIYDDEQIVEINAKMHFGEPDERQHYRIRIEGCSNGA